MRCIIIDTNIDTTNLDKTEPNRIEPNKTEPNRKEKTLVVDIVNGKEYIFESRMDASRFTKLQRKYVNAYINKGLTFNKQYKYYNL